DLINALLKPKGLRLKHMWHQAKDRLAFVEAERMNVYVLQVMSILRQAYCSPKYLYYLLPGQVKKVREADGTLREETLVATSDDFRTSWIGAVTALEKAIETLRNPHDYGAFSPKYLPYVAILPVFAALQAEAQRDDPAKRLMFQRKIRRWYWSSVF